MKKLTDKELEIMNILWDKGALSMRDLIEQMPNPKPHFNTVSTYVRRLESHGMIVHKVLGPKFYLYDAAMTREKYAEIINKDSIEKFFNGSYMDFISQLVQEQEISIDDLKELINLIEK
ncbi:MAG: BlaI/MecI/CopY family transcriptional regulator [Bacteroidaceae bacterium]|nr:BlaI/MecI/CopY family transcriptional regulator [Bacteroidaceae bacterium]